MDVKSLFCRIIVHACLKYCLIIIVEYECCFLFLFLFSCSPQSTRSSTEFYFIYVCQGELEKLPVYGDNYPTSDGTCRRDYIHVVDLAKGHLAAIRSLEPGFKAYNLGTGKSISVLEMIRTFEKVSNKPLPYEFARRRPGDLPEYWANPALAKKELNWQTELTIEDAIRNTLTFINRKN